MSKPDYLNILNDQELNELEEYMLIMYNHQIIRGFKASDIVEPDLYSNLCQCNDTVLSFKDLGCTAKEFSDTIFKLAT